MNEKNSDNSMLVLSGLRQMEVIDISEGKRLGFISDILFDEDFTKIDSFVIPPQGSFFSIFRRKDEFIIKWNQIKVIGVDIILVDLSGKKANDVI